VIATPPNFSSVTLGRVMIGIALVGPWLWLTYFDRLLRRIR
jgi:hypothetical protein